MSYYAVTIKENSIPYEKLTESVYQDWFQRASEKGLSPIKVTFEYDDKWRLHAHALCLHRSSCIWKQKYSKKNMHQHIQLLESQEDVAKWMIYMHKNYDYTRAYHQFCCIIENGGIQIEQPGANSPMERTRPSTQEP